MNCLRFLQEQVCPPSDVWACLPLTAVSPLIGSLIGLEGFEFQHADSSVVNRLFLCLSLMIGAERKCVYTSILQEELLSDEHSIC